MVPANGPMFLVILAIALSAVVAPKVVHAAKVAGHGVCHVITLGHKCK